MLVFLFLIASALVNSSNRKAAARNPCRLAGGAVAPSEEGGAMKTPKKLAPGSARKRGRGGLIRNLFNEDKSDRISVRLNCLSLNPSLQMPVR
jgi:hypothetical protein